MHQLRQSLTNSYQSNADQKRALILFNHAIATFGCGIVMVILGFSIGFREGILTGIILTLLMSLMPYLFKNKWPLETIGIAYVMALFASITVCIYYSGGFDSYMLSWMAIVPLSSLILINRKWTLFFVMASLIYVSIMGYLEYIDYFLIPGFAVTYDHIFGTFCFVSLVWIVYAIIRIFEAEKRAAFQLTEKQNEEIHRQNDKLQLQSHKLAAHNKELEEERDKADQLLLNILPEEVAGELKSFGLVKAKKYDQVSVLFSDFVDFEQVSQLLSPDDLVELVDYYFKRFDEIIEDLRIEKIKTIGDAYMCAGGLKVADHDHFHRMVEAAVRIQQFMASAKEDRIANGLPYFHTRIGIHMGPVTAGVVGEKKFAYDIWGDTVNLASRVKSKCLPEKVNISNAIYESIKSEFRCISRGKIEAKNIGLVDMYFVESY